MVWPFSSSSSDGVKKTSGGAFESPSRTNRAKCYEGRDAFFECLDRNNILDSINTKAGQAAATKACGGENLVFEKNCAHSWVEYFKKQRVVNYQKEQTIKRIEAEGGEIQAPQLPTRSSR
ncbi:cytochrome oxidase c subunit VIb-domain-containing protein [Lophiotrema nucula]|uniref:Cytochrome oxidase c subunit VIb-domain-containing protein n=1 Tax=Lophiotrema nucula TaxID=690887 RepID=A0A6A5ZPW7_9PLEO|nr:cytochrome oxidase c subunit VIb-domain-containing protein [Lophiotrema nucula]